MDSVKETFLIGVLGSLISKIDDLFLFGFLSPDDLLFKTFGESKGALEISVIFSVVCCRRP